MSWHDFIILWRLPFDFEQVRRVRPDIIREIRSAPPGKEDLFTPKDPK